MKKWFLNRLCEPSSWRGILALLTGFGVALDPAQMEAIVAAGLALMGVIGAFFPDSMCNEKADRQ